MEKENVELVKVLLGNGAEVNGSKQDEVGIHEHGPDRLSTTHTYVVWICGALESSSNSSCSGAEEY